VRLQGHAQPIGDGPAAQVAALIRAAPRAQHGKAGRRKVAGLSFFLPAPGRVFATKRSRCATMFLVGLKTVC
jgi:hypothetical protein